MVLVLINYTKPYEQVAAVVAEHRAFLGKHYAAGTLVVSGPRATKTGGIVLARGKSAAEVAEIFKQDPYALHGVAMIGSDGAELRQSAAAARVASLDAVSFCGEEAVQLHGGIGYTWESDCQFYYRRARALVATLGPRAWWADRLVRALEMRNRAAA